MALLPPAFSLQVFSVLRAAVAPTSSVAMMIRGGALEGLLAAQGLRPLVLQDARAVTASAAS